MKKQNTLISILIINYNNAKFIKRSIKSCLKQSYKNLEILIFDDRSTDRSKEVLKEFYKTKKIKIYFNKSQKKNYAALDAMNGYIYLFKKSKGKLIFFLDSDDYFHKDKIKKINTIFNKNKKIDFIQNLPSIKKNSNNNPLSFWPYLAPESCISFRRDLMNKFLKVNNNLKKEYNDIWLGFRMGVFASFCLKKFHTINEQLTFYESLGESKKYSFFGKNWIIRRKNAFDYLKTISKDSKILNNNFDYFLTRLFVKIINLKK